MVFFLQSCLLDKWGKLLLADWRSGREAGQHPHPWINISGTIWQEWVAGGLASPAPGSQVPWLLFVCQWWIQADGHSGRRVWLLRIWGQHCAGHMWDVWLHQQSVDCHCPPSHGSERSGGSNTGQQSCHDRWSMITMIIVMIMMFLVRRDWGQWYNNWQFVQISAPGWPVGQCGRHECDQVRARGVHHWQRHAGGPVAVLSVEKC